MWILHFIPDSFILWVTNLLLAAGVVAAIAGVIAHKIPVVWRYQIPFKILSLVLLAAGVYLRGGYGVEMAWRERVHEMELQISAYEELQNDLNKKIVELEKSKIKYIQGRTEYIYQYIDREVTKWDTKFLPGGACEIPREFIEAHNKGAAKPNPEKKQ